MPRDAKPLYRRGAFWLGWDRKRDGSLRSPYLAIFWYDPKRGRERSLSTRTADLGAAKLKLDAHYLEREQGVAVCPTCGQPRQGVQRFLVLDAISNYLTSHADKRGSASAIRARLAHVVSYIETLPSPSIAVEDLDDAWIERFRTWALAQPVQLPDGKTRERRAGTVEASVRMLAAAINVAYQRRDTLRPARFKALPAREVSRTPEHRADVAQLASMFAYSLDKTRRKRCRHLHRFLIASVATAARPDAVLDISTSPDRGQWNSERRTLNLNPRGRRQTKKYRPAVRAPWQFAAWLDADAEEKIGPFIAAGSVKHAWRSMAQKLSLPADGEAGVKLVRRSIGQLLRDRGVPETEIELQLGHRRISATTDLYAAFRPEHLANATREIENIIDEIEALVPGAFYRSGTGELPNVVPIKGAKSA